MKRIAKYDEDHWLEFYEGGVLVAAFGASEEEDYNWLIELWESSDWPWNKLMNAIKQITGE